MAEHEAETPEGEGEGEAPAKRKIPGRLIVLAGGGVFVVSLIIALVLWFFVFSSTTKPPAEGEHAQTEEGAKAEHGGEEKKPAEGGGGGEHGKAAVSEGPFELDDLIVNLSSAPGKRPSYLKLKVALELAKPEQQPELEKLKARIVDTFQVYLRELRVEDLQGSVGIVRLREELLQRVNAAVAPIEVRDVLFKEILVQ